MQKPYLKLRRLYEDNGLQQKELGELTGIADSTLRSRFNTPEEDGCWRHCEIVAICRVLNIPQEQIGEYFFPKVKKGESQ